MIAFTLRNHACVGASPDENIYFRKVTNWRDTIAVLASALQEIGDVFGVFSFFSLGRHKVFFESVKGFSEPWDARTQGRIGSVQPQASNRDGCAIRHATALLAGQPHAPKLLLLLSDRLSRLYLHLTR